MRALDRVKPSTPLSGENFSQLAAESFKRRLKVVDSLF